MKAKDYLELIKNEVELNVDDYIWWSQRKNKAIQTFSQNN